MNISVQIRPVARYVYDVFFGNGYDNWSRVRRYPNGVACVAGQRLSPKVCESLNKTLANHPNGSINAVNLEA